MNGLFCFDSKRAVHMLVLSQYVTIRQSDLLTWCDTFMKACTIVTWIFS